MRLHPEYAVLALVLLPSSLGACGLVGDGSAVDAGSGGQAPASSGGANGSGGAAPSGGMPSSGGAEATGSGGQDASSGGQGSGGEPPVCAGVVPQCEPGVQGCSERGEAYLCTECGQMDLLGESCVRLLVSDKEMGQVCSVRGETELRCAGGPLDWNTEVVFPVELPVFPSIFRLPDDASSTGGQFSYCWLDEEGAVGCSEGITVPERSGCTELALTDSSQFGNVSMCTLCAGQLDCQTAGAELSVTGVAEAGITDALPFWITTEGTVHTWYQDEPLLTGTYSSIIMRDNGLPCGIRDDGALVCVAHEEPEVVIEGDFVRGSASLLQVCVIDASGALSCFLLLDDTLAPVFSLPGNDFVDVVASHTKVCALMRAGVVVCWDDVGMLDEFSAKLN